MPFYNMLVKFLAPTGLYVFSDGSRVNSELLSYADAMNCLSKEYEGLFENRFLSLCSDEEIINRSKALGISGLISDNFTVSDMRNLLRKLKFAVTPVSFAEILSLAGFNTTARYDPYEETFTLSFSSKEELNSAFADENFLKLKELINGNNELLIFKNA